MAKSIPVGSVMCKYYIEHDQMKVIEGVLVNRAGKKWVAFGSETVPDEKYPGHRNIERVFNGGDILWLDVRDDALAKKLFTEYHVWVIKDLQRQIDEVGDKIAMIRKCKVAYGSSPGRRSKCFVDIPESELVSGQPEWKRQNNEHWDVSEITDVKQYAERKIDMLKKEMFIEISIDDERHILGLESHCAVDAAVRGMINKYWPVC